MLKVNNRKCIRNISSKSLKANRRRSRILIAAIALTTLMLTALFSVAGSMIISMQDSTMYQVGTRSHAGFKRLSQEQYDIVSKDSEIKDISYNIYRRSGK